MVGPRRSDGAVHEHSVGLLCVPRLDDDVVVDARLVEPGELPDAVVPHRQLAASEQRRVEVGSAADVGKRGHHRARLRRQPLCRSHALGRVEGGVSVGVEEHATRLRQRLVELEEGHRLEPAVDAGLDVGERLGRRGVLGPRPLRRRIVESRFVEQGLVVDEHDVGERRRQSVLGPAVRESLEGQRVVARRVDAVTDVAPEVEEGATAGVGHEVLVIELERVGRRATGDLRLQAREVVGVCRRLHLDLDVGMLGFECSDDGVEVFEVIRGRREREVAERHVLGRGAGVLGRRHGDKRHRRHGGADRASCSGHRCFLLAGWWWMGQDSRQPFRPLKATLRITHRWVRR